MDSADPYVYPGTDVLINRADIRDPDVLSEFESFTSFTTIANLRLNPVTPTFDLAHLQEIHRRIFDPVYPWAGEIRAIALTKPEIDLGGASVDYAPSDEIVSRADELLAALHGQRWNGLQARSDARRFAAAMADVWAVHPFREGNTRTVTLFFEQYAAEFGCALDASVLSKIPNDTRNALVVASTGNLDRLASLLIEARQAELNRYHPTLGRITPEAREVLALLNNPSVTAVGVGDTVRGTVLTTSYATVLVHGPRGVLAVPLDAFPTPPSNNEHVSLVVGSPDKAPVPGLDRQLARTLRIAEQYRRQTTPDSAPKQPDVDDPTQDFSDPWRRYDI